MRIHRPSLMPFGFVLAAALMILGAMLISESCTSAETMHSKIQRAHVQDQMAQAIADSANYSVPKQHR